LRRSPTAVWSFYICEKVRRIIRRMAVVHLQPSPPWGRGWRATGVLISRGATGEGVKTVKTEVMLGTANPVRPRRRTRSPARAVLQIDRARELCQTETESEQAAWQLLRGLRLKGVRFRRQHPLGQYIADFCCPQRRLIVELDGSVHGQPSQAKKDARRDTHLKNMGYSVLRLSNGMVLQAPELFVDEVLRVVWSLPDGLADTRKRA
jgi:very-short-patch-repair endonuclease